eukprot:PhM_4_TR8/c0_g1_i1/m.90255
MFRPTVPKLLLSEIKKNNYSSVAIWKARRKVAGYLCFVFVILPLVISPIGVYQLLREVDSKQAEQGKTVGVARSFWLPPEEDPLEVRQRRRHNDAAWVPWLGLSGRKIADPEA